MSVSDYTIADARSYGFGLLELYKLWHWNLCFPNTSDHDKINEMVRAAQKELDERYQLLPMDADGEVIHIGDEMTVDGRDTFTVGGIGQECGHDVVYYTNDGGCCDGNLTSVCHHCHKPTVEDVLVEFAKKMHDASFVYDRVEDTQQRIVREYAAKLQMRGEQDEA